VTSTKTFDFGRLTAELLAINSSLSEIKAELIGMRDWKISIETRLATGSQKFEGIGADIAELRENNKRRLLDDRAVLIRATSWGAGIGATVSVIVAAVVNLIIR
jgi:hypothetical protein